MINILIADDEKPALDRLKDLLADYNQFQIIAEAKDGTEALEKIVSLKPDVAFLDINMPGVSVFRTLSSLSAPPLIIFQTAHSKYAAEAFDVDALDYLLKPVSRERFGKAVSKIQEQLSRSPALPQVVEPVVKGLVEKISIKVQDAIKIIPVCDIQKICFEEGLTFIYTKQGRFLADHSLNHYEEKLAQGRMDGSTENRPRVPHGTGFFRSNRANLINLDFVTTIHKAFKGNFYMELQDGSKVELSRRKAQVLKKQFDF